MIRAFLLLAGTVAAASLHQVEVKMVGMFAVIARPENGCEIGAGVRAHAVEQAFFAESKEAGLAHRDALAVIQNDLGDIDRIAARMLRHLGATAMVHCAAGIATGIVNGVDTGQITKACRWLQVALDPARKGFCHLTIQSRGRFESDGTAVEAADFNRIIDTSNFSYNFV